MMAFVVVVVDICVFIFIFKEWENKSDFQVKENFWETVLIRNALDLLLVKDARLLYLESFQPDFSELITHLQWWYIHYHSFQMPQFAL